MGRNYRFDHHQIQEALYARLFVQLREQYHAGIGEALESAEPVRPVAICEHFLRGGAPERTTPYLRGAVDELAAAHLYGSAAMLAEQALLCEGLLRGADRIDLLQHAASWFEFSGNRETGDRMLQEAFLLAHELGDKTLIARTTRSEALRHSRRGRYAESEAMALKAAELARDAGDEQLRASCLTSAANALIWLGRTDEALGLYRNCLAIHEASGKPEPQLVDLGNIGRALAMLGRREEGLAFEQRALEMARQHRITWAHGRLTSNMGATERSRGHVAQSLALFEEALALCREMGNRASEAIVLVNVGWAHLLLGNHAPARDWLERALDLCRETESARVETYVHVAFARLHAQMGDAEAARASAQSALELRRKLKYGSGLPEALIQLAKVTEADEEAVALLDEAIEHATTNGQSDMRWLARAFRAQRGGGDFQGAGALDSSLIDGLDGTIVADRLDGCWALYEATGERRWLDGARAALEHLRDHAPAEFRDSMVERVPVYRAILGAVG